VAQRYFLHLAYDGAAYHGWQRQSNAPSVQETLERALSVYFREEVVVTGCGRTDTGVHASSYFAHFDLSGILQDLDQARFKLNNILPSDIAVFALIPVTVEAHARFDATRRGYVYHLHTAKDPFALRSAYVHYTLDLNAMNAAAAHLLEVRDFGAFCKAGSEVNNTLCDVVESRWTREGDRWTYHIAANRFLRNMVRAAVGTLIDVGRGYTSQAEFEEILRTGKRSNAGMSAPAHGLFLDDISYPFF